MFNKFAKMREPSSVNNIYHKSVRLGELPIGASLVATYPRDYHSSKIPLVNIIGKKITFGLATDGNVTGKYTFRRIIEAELK